RDISRGQARQCHGARGRRRECGRPAAAPTRRGRRMKDSMGMMKAASEMKGKMEAMQAELAELVVEGRSGGGMVTVSLSGKGDLRALKIDPTLANPAEVEVLEDLIIAAFNDAKGKSEAETQRKMAEVTAGLPLPPGMKLPF